MVTLWLAISGKEGAILTRPRVVSMMFPVCRGFSCSFFPALATAILACALVGVTGAWAAPARVLEDHPLAGKIWSSYTNNLTSIDDIVAAAEAADALLLGEKHDNARHHELQATLIKRLAVSRPPAAVVWEMIEPGLDPVLAAANSNAEALGGTLRWADTGWPPWAEYQPIADAAIGHRLTMYGAALPRSQVRALLDGTTSLKDLGARPLDGDRHDALLDQLEASHCGAVPRSALSGMASVQTARDAALAQKTADAIARGEYPIVITGNGHARRDRGIPWHLPRRTLLVVAFVEVQRDLENPALYLAPGTADFVWFTPRLDEKDPCERFRR